MSDPTQTASIMPPSPMPQQQGPTVMQMPQSPAMTPPTFETGNPGLDNLIKVILSSQQQKRTLAQPVPRPAPGQGGSPVPGTPDQTGHNWGQAIANMGSAIKGAATQHYQAQVAKAESEWNQLNTLMQDQSPAGQQKLQAWLISNKSALKGMAKALNQDWLNPEKTTAYGQARDNFLKQQQAKGKAKQGLMDMFKKLIGKANSNNSLGMMSPEQNQGMAAEIMGKAPTVNAMQDPKSLLDTARGVLDIEKASAEMRQKYQFITAADGKVWAINKNDPKDATQVQDKTGTAVTGQTKTSAAPKVLFNAGVPYGISRNGKLVTPDSDDWTKDDEKSFSAAKKSAQNKQNLRIDPIISDQLGEAPDPENYAKGKSDPAYGAALKKYGQQAEAIKNQMAGAQGAARAAAFNEYRPVQIYNPDTGNIEYQYAKNAIGQTPGAAAEKLLPKSVQIQDIEYASGKMRSAVQGMDKPFSPDQVAQLDLALSTGDKGMAQTIMSTLATQNLTDKQQDFVIWAQQLNERALSLRNVAGQGQGAQDTRNAIRALLPGIQSGSKEMQNKQLDAFDNMVKILKRGIAGVKGAKTGDTQNAPPSTMLKEGVNTTFSNGQTWTLQGGKAVQVQPNAQR